jgi:putative hydrolase of the HAD superfamily
MPTLIELRRMGLSLNIISNGRAVKQWDKILRLGLEAFFDNVIISEEVGSRKPERKIYLLAMEKAKCTPQESVFIDNDEECILGASSVGMKTVLMNRIKTNIRPGVSDHIINSLSELIPLLESCT